MRQDAKHIFMVCLLIGINILIIYHLDINFGDVSSSSKPPNISISDVLNEIKFTINWDICNVTDIGMVTIVHSAVDHFLHRSVIRNSWGNPNITGVNTRLVFLTGTTHDKTVQKKVEAESEHYLDVVQADFHDSYHNLSYKNIFGKLWVSRYCQQAEFVVKTDDDMFLDMYAIYHLSRPYLEADSYKSGQFVFCPVWQGNKIARNPGNKWYVSKEELPGGIYPPYCSGWLYVLNPKTAKRLVEASTKTKFLWVDDVWVTGILVEALGFEHIDSWEYLTPSFERLLVSKTAQHPQIYHRDFIVGPNEVDMNASVYMEQHSRWCYYHKCTNNIYKTRLDQLTPEENMEDVVIEHLIMKNVGYKGQVADKSS